MTSNGYSPPDPPLKPTPNKERIIFLIIGISAICSLLAGFTIWGIEMKFENVDGDWLEAGLWMIFVGSIAALFAAMFGIWWKVLVLASALGFTYWFTTLWFLLQGS